MSTVRGGYMVCGPGGEAASGAILHETRDEAERACDGYPVGCGYHVRPVEVTIRVLGRPPEPWCHRATPTPEPAHD